MYPVEELDADRRRKMMQEALSRGIQRPRANSPQSFMPGESAGIPDFLRRTPITKDPISGMGGEGVALNRGIGTPANTGLTLPQPATPSISVSGPPEPSIPTAPEPSPRIGYSTAGLTGLDRLIARRRALEEADAESKVTDSGEILPPEKTGRFRGAGHGLSAAASGIDPDRPLFSLGSLIGGGVKGLVAPRSAMKDSRRVEMNRLDNDLARGIKLEQEKAQLDAMRGPQMGQMSTRVVTEGEYPGLEPGTEIRTRIDPRTGQITDVIGPNSRPVIADLAKRPTGAPHYEKDSDGYLLTVQGGRATRVTDESGKPIQVKRSGEEEYVEVEVNGRKMRVTPGQALSYYGQLGERETRRDEARAEREAKYSAAKSEYDSLVSAEKTAGEEKNRAYQVLDQMRKSNQPKEDVAQAEQAAQEADRYYRSFAEKKKDAARRMQESQIRSSRSSSSGPPPPPNVTEASVRADARSRGANEDEAVRKARSFGWIP